MNSQVLENLSELELIDLCIKKNVWNSMTRLQRRGYIKRIKNLDDASDKQNTVDNETEEVKETEIVKETEQGVSKVKDKKPKINFLSGSFLLKTSNFVNLFLIFKIT